MPDPSTRKKPKSKKIPSKAKWVAAKRRLINDLVIEFMSASSERRQQILWGDPSHPSDDKSHKGVLSRGLVKEFDGFLNMYADIVKGVRPEKVSSHGKQMIHFRETEIGRNPALAPAIDGMEKQEVYHDLIFVFCACMLKFDPDRDHHSGEKKIHFVGYLNWNFKFYAQKMIQDWSKLYVESISAGGLEDTVDRHNKSAVSRLIRALDQGTITRDSCWLDIDDGESSPQTDQDGEGVGGDLDRLNYLGLGDIADHANSLSLREQQVISLRYVVGLTCKEVGERMLLTTREVIQMSREATEKLQLCRNRT